MKVEFFPDSKPVVVASHPRSGTHLTIDLLRRQFRPCASWKWPGERNDRLYCNIDELESGERILSERVARQILGRIPRPIIKSHAWVGLKKGFLPNHKGLHNQEWFRYLKAKSSWIYVYRDPRSVLCSYYLFCIGAGIIDAGTSISTFIRQKDKQNRTRVEQWRDHVQQWSEQPGVLIINFNDILNSTEEVLRLLGEHLKVEPCYREPLLPSSFPNIFASRRARLLSIRPESTAIINRIRLKWRNVFNENDLSFIHSLTGETLKRLGAPEWRL